MIEWIPREKRIIKKCRHCYDRVNKYLSLWSVFFETQVYSGWPASLIFDHISCDKYWFISEPYATKELLQENEVSRKYIQHALENGVKVYGIEKGYHYDGAVTLIFVPADKERFVGAVNRVLDKYDRYELWRKFLADKAGIRKVIRYHYSPPPAEVCLRMALNYLTWLDKKA